MHCTSYRNTSTLGPPQSVSAARFFEFALTRTLLFRGPAQPLPAQQGRLSCTLRTTTKAHTGSLTYPRWAPAPLLAP